ncbi:PREDICTED: probable salivary secreted peptide [Wasmannia auropunctata]|uniref:probable salivary secreted peptide n=1 Tax=Wasmannia auropunctata TaxID=64793 RepID=UPI0005EEF67F|nr:PREDICTED: probable salivary secreted peptide [Wasmannia auropunctata]
MSYKYIVGSAIFIAALLTVNTVPAREVSYSNKQDLIIGNRVPNDRESLKENVVKKASWNNVQIVEKTYNVSANERITMVAMLDQNTNRKGAKASVLQGGPGWSNVTVKFKSQRSERIDFIVQLYSRLQSVEAATPMTDTTTLSGRN